jgi:hypothetical protein
VCRSHILLQRVLLLFVTKPLALAVPAARFRATTEAARPQWRGTTSFLGAARPIQSARRAQLPARRTGGASRGGAAHRGASHGGANTTAELSRLFLHITNSIFQILVAAVTICLTTLHFFLTCARVAQYGFLVSAVPLPGGVEPEHCTCPTTQRHARPTRVTFRDRPNNNTKSTPPRCMANATATCASFTFYGASTGSETDTGNKTDYSRPEPATAKIALSGRDAALWSEALAAEWDMLWSRGTFKWVPVSERGDRQSRMPDEDNYASTVLPVVTRMIGVINLSLAASGKASTPIQLDIKKAFLRALGVPHRRVFVKVLQADGTYRFFEVLASLYGLRASPRRWQEKLTADLAEFGFLPCPYCPSLFVCRARGALASFHVDDGLLSCSSSVATALLAFLRRRTDRTASPSSTWPTPLPHTVGSAGRSRRTTGRWLWTSKRSSMRWSSAQASPKSYSVWTPQTDIRINKLAPPDTSFQKTVGSLLWATQTRPDCMYTVKELARSIANTDDSHRAAAQRCIRFLKATRDRVLTLKATEKLVLTAWIDTAFASCPVTLRSTSGMVIALGPSAVLCRSLTQGTVATRRWKLSCGGSLKAFKRSCASARSWLSWASRSPPRCATSIQSRASRRSTSACPPTRRSTLTYVSSASSRASTRERSTSTGWTRRRKWQTS